MSEESKEKHGTNHSAMITRSTLNQRLSKNIYSLSFYIVLFSCVMYRFLIKSLW